MANFDMGGPHGRTRTRSEFSSVREPQADREPCTRGGTASSAMPVVDQRHEYYSYHTNPRGITRRGDGRIQPDELRRAVGPRPRAGGPRGDDHPLDRAEGRQDLDGAGGQMFSV